METNQPTNDRQRAALAYVRRGWCPIPIEPPITGHPRSGKKPRLSRWTNLRWNEDAVMRHWGKNPADNIGILTGAPSGIIVLDFDSQECFEGWTKLHPEALNTFTVQRDNAEPWRCHLYYHLPDTTPSPKSTSDKGRFDLQSTGKQVVAPPSVHYTGGIYTVSRDMELLPWLPVYTPSKTTSETPPTTAPKPDPPTEETEQAKRDAAEKAIEAALTVTTTDIGLSVPGQQLTLRTALDALHRHDDGVVTFHRNPTGEWEPLFSLSPARIRELLPGIAEYLTTDAYWSMNAFSSPSRHPGKAGLPGVLHDKRHVRYLCACFVDLDVGRKGKPPGDPQGLDAFDVVGSVLRMASGGSIPKPSVLAYSCRGVYCLWLIHDDGTTKAARCHDHLIARNGLYTRLQRELYERTKHLAADPKARDVTRVFRVPGSVHSGVDREVEYMLLAGRDGFAASYTLHELAAALHIPQRLAAPLRAPQIGTVDDGVKRYPNRRNGAQAQAQKYIDEFVTLEAYRGGFSQGTRRAAIEFLCVQMQKARYSPPEIRAAAERLQTACNPPEPDSHYTPGMVADKVIDRLYEPMNTKMPTWAKRLKITETEVTDLRLSILVPTQYSHLKPAAPPKVSKRDIWLDMVEEHVRELMLAHPGYVPSINDVHKLITERGVVRSRRMIGYDIEVLQNAKRIPQVARKTSGRPRKQKTAQESPGPP